MFTLEESALLARMLRAVGWLVVCVLAGSAAYLGFRWVERHNDHASHPTVVHTRPAHHS